MPISGGTISVSAPSTIPQSATAVETSVAAAVASTQLLASNAARKGFHIFNDSASATLYVADASSASVTAYDFQVPPNGYYEAPVDYTGAVFGIWSAAVGNARITELS